MMIDIAEEFTTSRLCLRKPTLEDAPSIYSAYATDPEVTKYLSWKPHQNVIETRAFLAEQLSRWHNRSGFSWVIVNKTGNNIVGMMDVSINGFRADCGYVLAKSEWGQGYMSEVLIATRDLVFDIATIERFQIVCDVENPASSRVMEKAGFQKEGILRRYFVHPNFDSVPRDCLCYSYVRNRQ